MNISKSIVAFLIIVILSQSLVGYADTIFNKHKEISKDTVFVMQKNNLDSVTMYYNQILEKTNSQLSLWWNPYGLFVGMLGVLFAVFAIIAVFVVYRQSKEYKDMIKKSLEEHKQALEKLIDEKNNQLKIYEGNLDKSIQEYKEQLQTSSSEQNEWIRIFISKLEEQKLSIDTQIHTYRHAGWNHKDIFENYLIGQNTNFYARILLQDIKQTFVIYIRVITSDSQKIWLAFAGSDKNSTYSYKEEFGIQKIYNSKDIIINENVYMYFKQGFPELKSIPLQIDCIRLRGTQNDTKEIVFSYKII